MATAVAEAEAYIKPITKRIQEKVVNWWTDLVTLPTNHPLKTLRVGQAGRFTSPLQRIRREMYDFHRPVETIELYAAPPWAQRVIITEARVPRPDVLLATSTSARNGLLGISYGIYSPGFHVGQGRLLAYTVNQSTHNAEIRAIAKGLEKIS